MSDVEPVEALESFRKLAAEHLRFLLDDYGFREVDAKFFFPGMWLHFRNTTSQVAVHFEYGSNLWLTIGRLINFDGREVGGEQYNLDYLLYIRAPELQDDVRQMEDFDAVEIGEILKVRAGALQRYAADVLSGNFEIFDKLKQVRAEKSARRLADAGIQ
jgi:hypothetical protein